MPFLYTPRPFSNEDKRRAIAEVLDNAVPDRDFYLLVLGAVAFALCAIFTDSIAVLIASETASAVPAGTARAFWPSVAASALWGIGVAAVVPPLVAQATRPRMTRRQRTNVVFMS